MSSIKAEESYLVCFLFCSQSDIAWIVVFESVNNIQSSGNYGCGSWSQDVIFKMWLIVLYTHHIRLKHTCPVNS